jgi:ribosomal protein S12 methylthiotransferase
MSSPTTTAQSPHPVADTASPAKKVGMISLGCAKNLVDAEVMLGSIAAQGMEITGDADDADVLIVNTCAFIDSAKEESIDAILEAHQERGLTQRKPGQRLIVAGCMSQRFARDLVEEIPEVDAFMGLDQVAEAGDIVQKVLSRPPAGLGEGDAETLKVLTESDAPGGNAGHPLNLVTRRPRYIPDWNTPRFRLTPGHSAYTKIAEGCNHPCSFCVIPQMRGRHRSRTPDSVVREVRGLVADGVKEINLISQDTTYYGMDLWEEKAGPRQPVDSTRGVTLTSLLKELDTIPAEFWVRLLYTHPAHWSDELIEAIAECKKVARYIDIPLQHIHPEMLKTMRRETGADHIIQLMQRLRAGIPNLAIRTTFIVGFPGETEEHFEYLLDFIRETRFERLGIFTYSQEDGSRAAKMEGQVPDEVKQERYRRAMELQRQIAEETARAQVGRTLRVLTDDPFSGRTESDAPDVDCRVIFEEEVPVGQFLDVKIGDTDVYDLVAEPVESPG